MDILTFNLIDWICWGVLFLQTLYIGWGLLRLTNPPDPKPVPPGEIEDATIIYYLHEAVWEITGRYHVWYMILIAALLLLFV